MGRKRLRIATVLLTVVSAAALAGSARAVTATVGEPDLVGRLAITVPVTLTCDAPSPGLVIMSQSLVVRVQQAAGREIARGTAQLFAFSSRLLFPCDGTEATILVDVVADPAGPPFHGGPALVTGSVRAEAGVPFPCCPGSFTGPFETQSADLGLVEVRIH